MKLKPVTYSEKQTWKMVWDFFFVECDGCVLCLPLSSGGSRSAPSSGRGDTAEETEPPAGGAREGQLPGRPFLFPPSCGPRCPPAGLQWDRGARYHVHVLPACAGGAQDAEVSIITSVLRPEKKKRKTRGDHFKQRFRKNFTALLEEEVRATPPCALCADRLRAAHHHAALWLAELVREAGAKLPVSRGSSVLPAATSLLLRLWVPLALYLHHLRGALL